MQFMKELMGALRSGKICCKIKEEMLLAWTL